MELRTLEGEKDHKLVLKHFQIKLYSKLKTKFYSIDERKCSILFLYFISIFRRYFKPWAADS